MTSALTAGLRYLAIYAVDYFNLELERMGLLMQDVFCRTKKMQKLPIEMVTEDEVYTVKTAFNIVVLQ